MARITLMGAASALAVCGLVSTAAAQDPSGKPVPARAKRAPAKRAPAKKAAPKQAPAEEAAPKQAPAEEAAPDANCPPGAFCEQQEVTPAPEAPSREEAAAAPEESTAASEASAAPEQEGTTVVLPPAREGEDPTKPRTFTYVPDPDGGPGQLIIYEDGAKPKQSQPRIERQWKREKIEPPPEPNKKKWRRHRKIGLNLRAGGVLLPRENDNSNDIGMGALGMGLRFRPVPGFALELSGDFVGGTDTNGYDRQEIPIAATMMIYVNPKSLAQFYLMAGAHYAFARVHSPEPQGHLADYDSDEYNYFGGQGGMGLEFRVSRLVGINIDGLAFVRTRVDDDQDGAYPEFYDAETQESTNSSVAGLLRAGVTFWW
jgi:hypothetical protein